MPVCCIGVLVLFVGFVAAFFFAGGLAGVGIHAGHVYLRRCGRGNGRKRKRAGGQQQWDFHGVIS